MRKSIVESSKNVKKTRRLTRLEEAKELLRCQLITDQQAVRPPLIEVSLYPFLTCTRKIYFHLINVFKNRKFFQY